MGARAHIPVALGPSKGLNGLGLRGHVKAAHRPSVSWHETWAPLLLRKHQGALWRWHSALHTLENPSTSWSFTEAVSTAVKTFIEKRCALAGVAQLAERCPVH